MSELLNYLIANGNVPVYLDYRTGSLRNLGSVGTALHTSVNWLQSEGSRGIKYAIAGSRTRFVDNAAYNVTTLSLVALFKWTRMQSVAAYRYLACKNGASDYWLAYIDQVSSALNFWSGLAGRSYILSPSLGGMSFGVTWTGGTTPRAFVNASFAAVMSGGALNAVGAGAGDLYVGAYSNFGSYGLNEVMHAFALVNTQLSDADMTRLMLEMERDVGAISRPYRKFSRPYPALTAAEYAAQGITCDIPGERINGQGTDLVTGGKATVLSGSKLDAEIGGPFEKALRSNQVTGNQRDHMVFPTAVGNLPAGVSDWSIEVWCTRPTANSGRIISRAIAGQPLWFLQFSVAPNFAWYGVTGGVTRSVTNAIAAGNRKQWYHIVVTYDAGANVVMYLNGVPGTPTDVSAQVTTLNNAENMGILNDPSVPGVVPSNAAFGRYRVYNRVLTPAEIRTKYLEGARKLVLDARLPRDGSCPVGTSAVTAGSPIPGTPWIAKERSYIVQEAAFAGGQLGKRTILGSVAGNHQMAAACASAHGFWYVEMTYAGVADFMFVSTTDTYRAATNGYTVTLAANLLRLYRITAGAAATLFTATPAWVLGTLIQMVVTRSYLGLISVWAKGGGVYTDWTLVGSATDATHATGAYMLVMDTAAGGTVGDCFHLLGAMDPDEATREGVLSGAVFASFASFTTTDVTQNYTLRVTLGKPFFLDWGDGNRNWYTGTGADQAIAHNYAAAGTYTVDMRVGALADVLRMTVSGNSLSGSIPNLSLVPALTLANFDTNLLAGSIPSLTSNVALTSLHATNNALTGYTSSVLAVPLVDFQVQVNSLPQAAVDQILVDFLVGAAGRPGVGTIDLSGAGNAAPSAVGTAARAAFLVLQPGWTITVN